MKNIAVIGDLIADVYVYGNSRRISREAPVLIIEKESENVVPGGAANVCRNIKALGANPIPIGILGDDKYGKQIVRKLLDENINTININFSGKTPIKTRIIAGDFNTVNQHVLRIDESHKNTNSERSYIIENTLNYLKNNRIQVDGIVISDYNEGTITKENMGTFLNHQLLKEVPVFIDSRYKLKHFKNIGILFPNEPEIKDIFNDDQTPTRELGLRLLNELGCKAVVLKQGKYGLTFIGEEVTLKYESYGSREVADVTGAGDSVIAAFSVFHTSGLSLEKSAELANVVGGLKVQKFGTSVVYLHEIQKIFSNLNLS